MIQYISDMGFQTVNLSSFLAALMFYGDIANRSKNVASGRYQSLLVTVFCGSCNNRIKVSTNELMIIGS